MFPRIPHQEFQNISFDEKLDLLIHHGKFLWKEKESFSTRRLYRLVDYYVEVIMTPEDDSIILMRSFTGGALLDSYLEKISLGDIL